MDDTFLALLHDKLRFAAGEPITAESNLVDLGLDSMHAVELLFAIEDTFEVTLTDEQLGEETFRTAGSLWQVVTQARHISTRAST